MTITFRNLDSSRFGILRARKLCEADVGERRVALARKGASYFRVSSPRWCGQSEAVGSRLTASQAAQLEELIRKLNSLSR